MGSYIKENYVKDKVIIITGASSGFGAATAKKAAAMGGKIVLAARRDERLKAITEEIRAAGGEASYIKTDVRFQDQVKAMAKFAVDTYGRIDVLVNDAGTMPQAFYADHEWAMEAWEYCIDTCIKGSLYGICAVYDQMIAQGQGHVINLSSVLGNLSIGGSGVYAAAKVGVRYLADALRVEGCGKIRVTTIRPTGVNTTELGQSVVNVNASMSCLYNKLFDAFQKTPETVPGMMDRNSVQLNEPIAEDLADNIIYAINQPWGVDISDITVRASGESLFA
ncbi:MAG: SDR family oxidoreductase [Oscillospiraceae bacterium]